MTVMPDCPKCRKAMSRRRNDFGVFWNCSRCEGSAVTMSLLRKMVAKDALDGLWQRMRLGSYPRKHPCPSCKKRMEQIVVDAEGRRRAIDVCSTCQFVWLDQGEWADLAFFALKSDPKSDALARVRAQIAEKRKARNASSPKKSKATESYLKPPEGAIVAEPDKPRAAPQVEEPKPVKKAPSIRSERKEPPVSRSEVKQTPAPAPKPRREVAKATTRERLLRRTEERVPRTYIKRPKKEGGWGAGPTEFWHWIPALLGMPVEDEQPDGRRSIDEKPWCTWMLALGVTLVSLIAMFDLRAVVDAYGLIPAQWDRLGGLTWLSSFFIHGGFMHLIGNIYFLVIFGDNVERCLGTLEFFFLLVLATVFGSFVHILFDPGSPVPCVGASGGISGVIAFYALRFPKNQMAVMFWFIFKTYWWRMSAIWLFAIWVVLQIIISGQQIAGYSLVSGGAHIGGALVGVVAWWLWRINGGAQDNESRFAGAYLKDS